MGIQKMSFKNIPFFNNFHEYLIQHSLKSGGTKDHFSRVKVPGTAPYRKARLLDTQCSNY